ncbi:MAG: S8 family peptidase [Crocinitomicaceae bacterium]|nr:S8 family peptidase [Crocinitomicaceae bacterium]
MRIILLLLLLPFSGIAQVQSSGNTRADVQHLISEFARSHGQVNDEIRNRFAVNNINGEEYVSFLAKIGAQFSTSDLESRGFLVGAKINDIVSFKCPINELTTVLSDQNFSYIEIAGKIKPMLNRVPADVRADSVWMGANLPEGYTGKDVIIGVQDWGFDYTSPNYYDTLLANSRILAAWDQFKNSGPAPAGYSYGTEYSTPTDLINAESDTSNIYSYATHGSHVAGIAGGSGAGTEFRGIAFESEFLFTTFLVDESAVIDSWEWMKNSADAEGKRLVVNMSWGLYHMQAIDGTSLLSQALDYYSDLGVVFVTSAGNNGGENFHIKKDFVNDSLLTRINFYYSPTLASLWGQSIHAWGTPGEEFSIGLKVLNSSNTLLAESQYFSTATTAGYIDTFLVAGTDTVFFNLSCDAAYPTNSRPQARLRVKRVAGSNKIVLKSQAASGSVHFWNVTELTTDVGNWGMPFTSLGSGYTAGNEENGIGTPACSNTAITVAAYASNYYTGGGTLAGGALANFSSTGPLMNDTLKPDISAPGIQVTSSMSSFTDAAYSTVTSVDFQGRTYDFARLSGTSMSSPVVAGVVALILDANPTLTPAQVKDIIIQTAREDNHTGVLPPEGDVNWGHGKINAYLAVQTALGVVGTVELHQDLDWTIYPNPASESISLKGLEDESITSIKVLNMNGAVVLDSDSSQLISVSELKAGMYFTRIVRNGKVEQQKFIVK